MENEFGRKFVIFNVVSNATENFCTAQLPARLPTRVESLGTHRTHIETLLSDATTTHQTYELHGLRKLLP